MFPNHQLKTQRPISKNGKHLSPIENLIKPDSNKIIKKKVIIKDKIHENRKVLRNNDSKGIFKSPEKINDFKMNGDLFKKFLEHYEKRANGDKDPEVLSLGSSKLFKNDLYPLVTSMKNLNEQNIINTKALIRPRSEYNYKKLTTDSNYKENLKRFETKINENRPFSSDKNLPIDSAANTEDITAVIIKSGFSDKMSDYIVGKEIGKGAYAVVRQAIFRPTGAKIAIKIYEKYKLLDPAKKGAVKREIGVLKMLDHQNLVKLYEVIDSPKQIWLIMELIDGLSLLSFLKSKPQRKIEETDCKYIFSQIMRGINYLHSKGICHRDIKLENIIIDNNLSIKIIDFGFGAIGPKSKLQSFFCGTPSYMPPEIVQKKDYVGLYADIWSIGILLFTLLSGSFPFRGNLILNIGISEKELYSKIIKGNYIIPESITGDAKNLIQKILIVNPINRISTQDILLHNWLNLVNPKQEINV